MIPFIFYLCFGIMNVVVSFDQNVLMISDARWRRSPEAWVEAVLYLLLWPLQLGYWVLTRIHLVSGSLLERMFR